MASRPRLLIGVVLLELRAYLAALLGQDRRYLAVCNRNERLEPAPDEIGFRCDWRWTSILHAPTVIPALGRHLMRRALQDHPVCRSNAPVSSGKDPQVSFVIGHRGMERLPHLLATLETIAAQRATAVECIVVEQDTHSRLAAHLPAWVRLLHTPPPADDMPYCRSWAFNVGARYANSGVLVLHDNDLLVPAGYAAAILARVHQGYEVVNLKRFIFYLTQAHTKAVFDRGSGLLAAAPGAILQNLEGGGSVAITRSCFDAIGGMDESFLGWGGEDNEFWERAATRRLWPFGLLPLVHLWHPAQAGKQDLNNPTLQRQRALSAVPPGERIDNLRTLPKGQAEGPFGWRKECA